MLKGTNNDALAKKGIDADYHLFFQIWKELTDRRTINSYQFRMMNPISILSELNEIILLQLERTLKHGQHTNECRLEAFEIIKSSLVIKKYFRAHWNKLLKCLNKKPDSDASLRSLHYTIEYAYNALNPTYLSCLFSELEQAIKNKDHYSISNLTNNIVSYCVSTGWSQTALYFLVDNLSDDQSNWEELKNCLLSPSENEYEVYIPVRILSNPPSGISRSSFDETIFSIITEAGINVLTGEEIGTKYNSLKFEKISQEKYMQFNEEAYDPFSACTKASEKCSTILNLLSFFNYIEPWSNDQLLFLTIESKTGSFRKITPKNLYSSTNYVISGKKLFGASKDLLFTKNSTLGTKLRSSYSFINIGKGSNSLEDKFINTWVALESLCRSDAYENIASNILSAIPPALCQRYIYRLFNNFIEDCFRCHIDLSFPDSDLLLSKGIPRETRARNLTKILKDVNLSQELESRCTCNTLLYQRFEEIKPLATNPSKMFEAIKKHYRTTKRQLARLYRVRNLIAHTGTIQTDSLALYNDHLANYFIEFTLEMISASILKNEDRVEVLIELIRNSYDVFLQISEEKDSAILYANLTKLLDCGIIDYL